MWQPLIVVLCMYMTCTGILPVGYVSGQDLTTLCPYNDFCKTKATKVRGADEAHLVSCCQNCSCDRDCQLYGDCCPDMELTPGVEPRYPCVNLNSYFNTPRGLIEKDITHAVGYRLIDGCPNAELSLIYPRCTKHTDLEDFILITDKTTDRLYKNKHCALCNGVNVNHFVEWKLITTCRTNITQVSSLEDWHHLLIASCFLIPYNLDPNLGQMARCPLKELGHVFECPNFMNMGNFNEEIKKSCEKNETEFNNMYTYPHRHLNLEIYVYYSNVFCTLCDQYMPYHQELPKLCKSESALNTFKSITKFSTMINFKKRTNNDKEVRRCGPTQIWNPYNASCMAVRCPFATYPYYGQCEDMYTSLPGDHYDVIFKMTFDQTIVNQGVNWNTLQDLQNAVAGIFTNTDCLRCSTGIMFDSKLNYFLRYAMAIQGSCNEHYIISKTQSLLQAPPLKVRIGNITEVILSPYIWHSSIDKLDTLVVTTTRRCSIFNIVVNWHKIYKCPRVPINSWGLNETTLTAVTTEIDGAICVDEYFRIMASLNYSQSLSPRDLILYLVVLMEFALSAW